MIFLERLEKFYEEEGQEELRLQKGGAQYIEFLTATKYLTRHLKPDSKILDSCSGSGAYAFYLAERGHEVTAGDIVAYNVEIIRRKQEKFPVLAEVYQGDAMELSRFADGSFDAVLCMGALYHMDDSLNRKRVVDESLRLLKDKGLFACTYMSRYAVILNNSAGKLENIDEILRFAAEGKEDVFYASTPAEIIKLMADCGLEKVCHVSLDGMANFMHLTAKLIDGDGFERWQKYHFAVCEEESLLGCGYHNLFIGRKTV